MDIQKTPHVDDPVAVGVGCATRGVQQGSISESSRRGPARRGTSRVSSSATAFRRSSCCGSSGKRLGVSADYLATGVTGTDSGDIVDSVLVDAQIALRLDDIETARRLFEQALTDGVRGNAAVEALAGLGRIALSEGDHEASIEL